MKKRIALVALVALCFAALASSAAAAPSNRYAGAFTHPTLPERRIALDAIIDADPDPQTGIGHNVGLTWTPGSVDATHDAATSFNVKRALVTGGPYTTIGTSTTPSYTDLAVTAGTKYFYVVTGVNTGGESAPSNEASALIPSFSPAPPSGLSGTPK